MLVSTTGGIILKAARTAPGRTINPSGRMMRAMERDAEARIARALDKMRRDMMRGVTAYNAHLMPARLGSREVLQPFTDSLTDVLRDIALAGSEFGQEQINRYIFGVRKQVGGIDINWELANTAAEDWARRYGYDLVGGVTRTTQRRVQKEIAQWTTNNESLFQLKQRLSAPNGPFSPKRARTIAVTETTRAYAEGNTAAWKESGVVEKREWNTNIDELVCPICGPLHNVTAELGKPFPGGLMNPPAHPNCRCWILPVIEGAEEFETGLEQYGLQPTATGHADDEGLIFAKYRKAAYERHPRLAVLEDSLYIYDDGDIAQRHLKDLDKVPTNILEIGKDNGVSVYISSDKTVPYMDALKDVRGVRPRGYPKGSTWDSVEGAYQKTTKKVIAGGGGDGTGSVSIMLHEYGHSVFHTSGFKNSVDIGLIHVKQYDKLSPYFRQGLPGNPVGMDEMFAEAFAHTFGRRNMATQFFGELISWIEKLGVK